MSRQLGQRWELTGTFVAASPVRVGNIDTHGAGELTQARDGLDRPVLPGTALAGVIRSHLPARLSEHQLWGRTSGKNAKGQDDDTGRGSWVSVDDATAPADTAVEFRETTSIDRITGTVARGHLFTQEILPSGTAFDFRFAVDDPHTGDQTEARDLFDAVVDLLRTSGITVGAATSRGLGRVRMTEGFIRRTVLSTRDGMLAALRDEVDRTLVETRDPTVPAGTVRIRVPWRPRGPLMVRVAAEAVMVSAHPLTTQLHDTRRLVLPGSSLKGVLRSQAEKIMRTIHGADTPSAFLDQLRGDGLGPVVPLFGTANDTDPTKGWRGALTAHECLGADNVDNAHWSALQHLKEPTSSRRRQNHDGPTADQVEHRKFAQRLKALNDKLDKAGAHVRFTVAHHVAVDRWTGGAADQRLFAVLEPEAITADAWDDIVLDIDTRRLDQHDHALTLLLLVLRDLCEGWLGIGYGTTRGLGAVAVAEGGITFESGADVTGVWSSLAGGTLASVLSDEELIRNLMATWPPAEPDRSGETETR